MECVQPVTCLLAGRLEGLASLSGHLARLLAKAPPELVSIDQACKGVALAAELSALLKPLEDVLQSSGPA